MYVGQIEAALREVDELSVGVVTVRQAGVAIKLVETAILHHHHAPAELAKAKEDKRLIAEAYTRVSTHEAEEKAEKAKAAAMKKLRKIEEEEDDVEPSDVARGKGKMRRLK